VVISAATRTTAKGERYQNGCSHDWPGGAGVCKAEVLHYQQNRKAQTASRYLASGHIHRGVSLETSFDPPTTSMRNLWSEETFRAHWGSYDIVVVLARREPYNWPSEISFAGSEYRYLSFIQHPIDNVPSHRGIRQMLDCVHSSLRPLPVGDAQARNLRRYGLRRRAKLPRRIRPPLGVGRAGY
jgi:hypothetical protein